MTSKGLGALGQQAITAGILRELVKRGELVELAATQGEDARLSSKEVGLMLRRHHKTIEKWTRTRGLPCEHIGRNLEFVRGDVLRWLAQQG